MPFETCALTLLALEPIVDAAVVERPSGERGGEADAGRLVDRIITLGWRLVDLLKRLE